MAISSIPVPCRYPLPRSPPVPHSAFAAAPLTRALSTPPLRAAEDLDEEGLDQVKASIGEVFDNPPAHATYSEMARRIRVDLDKKMHGGSRGWSVVVGRSFGAYITQKIKNYAYVSVFPGAWKGEEGEMGGGWAPRPRRPPPRRATRRFRAAPHERLTFPQIQPHCLSFSTPASGVNVLVWKV